MTNIEIKKAIQTATKRIDNYKIELQIWKGDGTFHPEGTIINNEIAIYDNENENKYESIFSCYYGIASENEIFENEIEILRKEQKEMKKYLKKHFNVNISIGEFTV